MKIEGEILVQYYSSVGKIGERIIDILIVMAVETKINHVHAIPWYCITKTLRTPHIDAIIKSRSLGLILSNLSKNKLSRVP